MSPPVKHLYKIRNKSIRKEDNEQLQNRINTLNRENMVTAVKNKNGKMHHVRRSGGTND